MKKPLVSPLKEESPELKKLIKFYDELQAPSAVVIIAVLILLELLKGMVQTEIN